jgi:hypothetical protein
VSSQISDFLIIFHVLMLAKQFVAAPPQDRRELNFIFPKSLISTYIADALTKLPETGGFHFIK